MTDETKLLEQIDRGGTASLVLKELESACKALEEDCFKTFRSSDLHDEAGWRASRYYLRVLDDVRERFRKAVIAGDAAHKELIRMKPQSKLKRIVNG